MTDALSGSLKRKPFVRRFLSSAAAWGPGMLVMLADTDAGNVVTASQSGAQWGYRLLPLLLALIPLLYMVQELAVRLGVVTGRGHGELIRARFGRTWSWVALAGLATAVVGSLVTEFTGVAGIGELYGVSRSVTLPGAAVVLILVVLSGSYRRTERAALLIGLFELAFFYVAWVAHPDVLTVARHAVDLPLGNHEFLFLAAALIGAVFNPWMVFYQQSAVADNQLALSQLSAARWDTALGAILTQCLTGAVLVAAAATFYGRATPLQLDHLGDISMALTAVMGDSAGKAVFSIGVLGSAMVAAVVSSLALAWGVSEVAGYRRVLEVQPARAPWFAAVYVLAVTGSVGLVWVAQDLVWLNIVTQVANAFMLPLVLGFLIALGRTLPGAQRLRGAYMWVMVGLAVVTSLLGLVGGLSGLLGG